LFLLLLTFNHVSLIRDLTVLLYPHSSRYFNTNLISGNRLYLYLFFNVRKIDPYSR
jgi:hypothetical protein